MKGSSKDAITSKKPSELKLKKDDIDWLLALGFDYLIVKKGSFLIRTVRCYIHPIQSHLLLHPSETAIFTETGLLLQMIFIPFCHIMTNVFGLKDLQHRR